MIKKINSLIDGYNEQANKKPNLVDRFPVIRSLVKGGIALYTIFFVVVILLALGQLALYTVVSFPDLAFDLIGGACFVYLLRFILGN